MGNIGPEQGDYLQMVKGGGHGNYRTIVVAPNCVQEMCDLTIRAFELADKYRNPVIVLADGVLGQMMEAVEFPAPLNNEPSKPWAVTGEASTRKNLIASIYLEHEHLEAHITKLAEKYLAVEREECRWEEYAAGDAQLLLVAYGITSRVARAAAEMARAEGIKAGLVRPVTLYPFPHQRIHDLAKTVRSVVVAELSSGQLIEDVRLAVEGLAPVHLLNRTGGMIPTAEDVLDVIKKMESKCVGNYA